MIYDMSEASIFDFAKQRRSVFIPPGCPAHRDQCERKSKSWRKRTVGRGTAACALGSVDLVGS